VNESRGRVVAEKNVAAGLNTPERTVGLHGLVALEVIAQPAVTLRGEPGILRVQIVLPQDFQIEPGAPISYRVFGGEAGLEFDHNGQIVELPAPKLPLELRYTPRVFPTPPPRGQMSLDLSFWYREGTTVGIQDVQWRQPVVWDKRGGTVIELRFPRPA